MRTPTPPSSPNERPLIDRLRAATAGRYTIGAELGAGGMATVFRATEIALEREVAIKVMSMEVASTPGAVERFRREARVAAALSHPHIVPIYAIGEDPKLAFFAMKYIEGRGLDSILKKDPMQSVEMVVKTIATVGRALAHAHEKGVVHRDVKPANIMVGNDGWLYVTDFGIAKRDDAQGLTQVGTVIGTPAYMSPEQFNGQTTTGAADQYSLGVVAYEMLAGRAPFNGPSLGEIMRGHLLEPPPALRTLRIDIPAPVVEVVNRMLAKDPADRFATLNDAAAALEGAGAGAKGMAPRRTVPTSQAAAELRATTSPTTPMPRNSTSGPITGANSGANSGPNSGAARRPVTATHARPEPVRQGGGGTAIAVFALLAAALGGGWYVFREDISAAMRPAPVASIAPELPSTPLPELTADTGAIAAVAESTAVAGADSTPNAGDPADAIADLAARLASAPVMDVNAPADSVVVRVGSQTMQTVLFVNDQQVGILGGMGLVSVTVPPGPVKVQVRKVNCRDWDTTFTPVTGRRYSFMERSPTC